MYVPSHFAESEPSRLQAFMRANDFALIVSAVEGRPFATHVPILLDAERGRQGTLVGHMARGNPHWRSFGPEVEVLVIFNGPHCYISPTWYETAPNVPTWNYAAVHAYGRARTIDDPLAVRSILDRTVTLYEGEGEGAWSLTGLPEDYLERMIRGVAAFEIEIERLEGKFKLSQNRADPDRRAVLRRLEASGEPREAAVGAMMRERETEPTGR